MVSREGVVAVLDWEIAHIGDPMQGMPATFPMPVTMPAPGLASSYMATSR